MTESKQKDIIKIIRGFREYHISQLKKNLKIPIKCHLCKKDLEKEQGFFHYTTIDKWDLIRPDLIQFIETNPKKSANEELWDRFEKELTVEPVIFVCEDCRPQANINLDFSTIFNNDAPRNFKSGALKTIFKPENLKIQCKFFQKIPENFKKPNKIHQKSLWEAMGSVTSILIATEDISFHVTKWMTLIENLSSIHDSIVYPLSTIGLLIPKTDCKQFSRCLSKLSKNQISKIFHNMSKKVSLDIWYVLFSHLELNLQKIAFLNIIQNHNTKILEKIFENFINYPDSFQNYLISQIESIDDIALWEKLKKNILPEDFKEIKPEIQEKIHTILENYEKEKLEVKEQQEIYLKHQKNEENKRLFFEEINPSLTRKYRKIVEHHLKTYQDEFDSFFKIYPENILGFDTESINKKMICVMGIKIKPNLSFNITTRVIDDIYRINESSKKLKPKFTIWIKNKRSKWVITHGFNWKEYKLARKSYSIYINSADFLQNILAIQKPEQNYLLDVGLRHFEQYISFKRVGCGIIKHRTKSKFFFEQFLVSLDRHLWKEPQRQCNLCGKTQDVLSYCLEDAFVSMLIVVWCVNRNLIPKKQKNFFQINK